MTHGSAKHIIVEVAHEYRGRMVVVEKMLEQAGMDIIARFDRAGVFVGLVAPNKLDEIRKAAGVWDVESGA